MRLNQFLAQHTSLSRRSADKAIVEGRVTINELLAHLGAQVRPADSVQLDGESVRATTAQQTVILNKPVGYVCSRDGQGSKTIYDLLPKHLHNLNPVGRLDKDSSGLLVLTNNGKLAHELAHPSFHKSKVYDVVLDKSLTNEQKILIENGVELEDGLSRLILSGNGKNWQVRMHEGRNRQIRRTFEAVGPKVTKLYRTQFGPYALGDLAIGKHQMIKEAKG